MRRRLVALVAIAGAALALSACGGSEEAEFPGDWVVQVDSICTDGTERAGELAPPVSYDQVIPDARDRMAIIKDVRDGIEATDPPEGIDDAGLQVYLDELEGDIGTLERIITAFKANEQYLLLDVTSGLAANNIGLAGCVTLSDTIARMLPSEPVS